jgi:decaprenylphospho-beta-D-ribofuranose 2-oxidase
MTLSGWGNVIRHDGEVYRPERIAETRAVLAEVAASPTGTIVARGLGRSYGDAAINQNGAVLLDTRLDRFTHFDPATGLLECEAGVSYAELIDVFLPRGFFPPVTPGTRFVTLGGALAADVHGKNHHRDGSISAFVESFELLTADGQTLRCSRTENPDAFLATLGGMGLTGVILTVKLRLSRVESAYVLVDHKKTANLDETLAAFGAGDGDYQYSVAWIDCLATGDSLGRSVLMRGNHAKAAELPPPFAGEPLKTRGRRRKNVPFQTCRRTPRRTFLRLLLSPGRHRKLEPDLRQTRVLSIPGRLPLRGRLAMPARADGKTLGRRRRVVPRGA